MIKRTNRSVLVVMILFIFNICNAQGIEQKFQFVLDSVYQANKEAIGFAIHIESPNKSISWSSSVGFSSKDCTEKLNKNQALLIASNTKTYVSAAILKLVENRVLKLDQPIKKKYIEKRKGYFEKMATLLMR